MLADTWTVRPGSVYGRGHPDQPDAAHSVQADVTADREPDNVGARVNGLDGLYAGSQHGPPSKVALPVMQPVPQGPLKVLIDGTAL
jgi:hypothetical protein